MADDFVTFDDKFLTLRNVMPPVTFEELYAKAKVRLLKRRMAKQQVFNLDLRWGGGEDLKTHTLRPGQQIRMAEKIGREIAQDFKPSGEICASNPGLAVYANESEREAATIDALNIAATHYHVLGAVQLDKLRSQLGHRDDEVEGRYRNSTYASFFVAIAKEELIREHMEELLTDPCKEEPKRKAG